jgi:hypothetical protein
MAIQEDYSAHHDTIKILEARDRQSYRRRQTIWKFSSISTQKNRCNIQIVVLQHPQIKHFATLQPDVTWSDLLHYITDNVILNLYEFYVYYQDRHETVLLSQENFDTAKRHFRSFSMIYLSPTLFETIPIMSFGDDT